MYSPGKIYARRAAHIHLDELVAKLLPIRWENVVRRSGISFFRGSSDRYYYATWDEEAVGQLRMFSDLGLGASVDIKEMFVTPDALLSVRASLLRKLREDVLSGRDK